MVGQAEKVIPLSDILVETCLWRHTTVGIGRMTVKVALHPKIPVAVGQGIGIDEFPWRVGHVGLLYLRWGWDCAGASIEPAAAAANAEKR